jgi:MSHA biogenesis protein MshJ
MNLPDIRQWLQPACEQFESKTVRERLLMVFAAAALMYFIVDISLLTPQAKAERRLREQIESQLADVQKLDRQIAELSAKLAKSNASDRRAELDELLKVIAEADALLSEDDGGSLKLSALLDAMLRTTPNLQLVSLKTLPVTPLLAQGPQAGDGSKLKPAVPMLGKDKDKDTTADAPPVAVHQHAVEIAVKGNFLAMLPYMAKLRRYPKRLFWASASLDVQQHPDAVLHLTITTLSAQRTAPLE